MVSLIDVRTNKTISVLSSSQCYPYGISLKLNPPNNLNSSNVWTFLGATATLLDLLTALCSKLLRDIKGTNIYFIYWVSECKYSSVTWLARCLGCGYMGKDKNIFNPYICNCYVKIFTSFLILSSFYFFVEDQSTHHQFPSTYLLSSCTVVQSSLILLHSLNPPTPGSSPLHYAGIVLPWQPIHFHSQTWQNHLNLSLYVTFWFCYLPKFFLDDLISYTIFSSDSYPAPSNHISTSLIKKSSTFYLGPPNGVRSGTVKFSIKLLCSTYSIWMVSDSFASISCWQT